MRPQISVIIPVLNEENTIGNLLSELRQRTANRLSEILVVDGGSRDRTWEIAKNAGGTVIKSGKRGRAAQMNAGAAHAKGEILYFLHADTIPPPHFDALIEKTISEGFDAGCFRLRFDDPHPGLRFYAWFTRFRSTLIRFGDQSLFLKSSLFTNVRGFDESLVVMEDQKIVRDVKRLAAFKVVNEPVVTSARKYRENGVYRLQTVFFLIWAGYYLGLSQAALSNIYKTFIK